MALPGFCWPVTVIFDEAGIGLIGEVVTRLTADMRRAVIM